MSAELDFQKLLKLEGDLFLQGAANVDLSQLVTTCPGWTVANLVSHLGRSYYYFAQMVASQNEQPSPIIGISLPPAGTEIQWSREGLDKFLNVAASHSLNDFAWSWTSNKTVGFVVRRMLHETLVHRWDLDISFQHENSTDPSIASDCIDEMLESYLLARKSKQPLPSGSVHIHCTDTEGEWILEFGSGTPGMRREHTKGDVALRGTALELAQVLWRRRDLAATGIEIFGDAVVAQQMLRYSAL